MFKISIFDHKQLSEDVMGVERKLLSTYLKIFLRYVLTLSLVISLASIGFTDLYSYISGIRHISESLGEKAGTNILIVYPGSLISSDIEAIIPNNPSIYEFIRKTTPLKEEDFIFLKSLPGVKRVIPFGVVGADVKFEDKEERFEEIMYFDIENNRDILESLFIFIGESGNISNRSMFLDYAVARKLDIKIGEKAKIGYYNLKKMFRSIDEKVVVDGYIIFTAGRNSQAVVDSKYMEKLIKARSNMTLYNALINDGYLFQYNGFLLLVEADMVPQIVGNITRKYYDDVIIWTSSNPRSILVNISRDFVGSLFVTTSTYLVVLVILIISNILLWRKNMNRILYLFFTFGLGRFGLLRITSIFLFSILTLSLIFSYIFYFLKGMLFNEFIVSNLYLRYGRVGLLTFTIRSFVTSLYYIFWNIEVLMVISIVLSILFVGLMYLLFMRSLKVMFKGEINV